MGIPLLLAFIAIITLLSFYSERRSIQRECQLEKTSTLSKLHLLATHKWDASSAERKIQRVAQVDRNKSLSNGLVPGISDEEIQNVCRNNACSL